MNNLFQEVMNETHLQKGEKIKDGDEELTIEKPVGKHKYIVSAKEPVKESKTDNIRIGSKVHIGHKTKGGAGILGFVTKLDGDYVYIETAEKPSRIIRGLIKNTTLEEAYGSLTISRDTAEHGDGNVTVTKVISPEGLKPVKDKKKQIADASIPKYKQSIMTKQHEDISDISELSSELIRQAKKARQRKTSDVLRNPNSTEDQRWAATAKDYKEGDRADRLLSRNVKKYNPNYWEKESKKFSDSSRAQRDAIIALINQKKKNGTWVESVDQLLELSNQLLAAYKKKSSADASLADKQDDTNRANKRFRGVMKATKKQFANDQRKRIGENTIDTTEERMITFNELLEMWPGTKDYEAKYGKPKGFTGGDTERRGNRHDITVKGNVTRATRRTDDTGDTAEPDKKVEIQDGPKRGRGRPPGKYGAYKKRVKESLEIIESLETNEEIEDFLRSLDEKSYNELVEYFNSIDEDVGQLDELSKDTLASYADKANKSANYHYDKASAAKPLNTKNRADNFAKHIKTADKRYDGYLSAHRKIADKKYGVKEDIDQLDELSKDTLKSYYGKAGSDRHDKKKELDTAKQSSDTQSVDRLKNKIHARSDGIEKVKSRFAENTEISESLSVDSLAAFISKNKE